MPVLMNKGTDPRQAAWLFYSSRPVLGDLADAIIGQRLDSGRLEVDGDDLAAAKKASSEVPVYLSVKTLVPEDFDLDADTPRTGDAEDSAPSLPYVPVEAPEPIRVRIGDTTAQAARDLLAPRDLDGTPWTAELPGLQALARLIACMRDASVGIPPYVIWHVDPQGIMRMAPAKSAKPMAGNILKAKL